MGIGRRWGLIAAIGTGYCKAHLLFGLRHSPAMGAKLLNGVVVQAELYDRALSPEEASILAGDANQLVSEEMLLAKLSPEAKKRRAELSTEIGSRA